MLLKLLGALAGEIQHVFLAAKVQAAGGARLDAGRFEAFADAVTAERALEDAIILGIHLGISKGNP